MNPNARVYQLTPLSALPSYNKTSPNMQGSPMGFVFSGTISPKGVITDGVIDHFSLPPSYLPCTKTRSVKFKTELCRDYMTGRPCKFGVHCDFAHGKEELRKLTYADLKVIDESVELEKYRTRPCFTYVSTGACPLEDRCKDLHDPAVCGSEDYWLPRKFKQDRRGVGSDLNVDILTFDISNAVHSSPFCVREWDSQAMRDCVKDYDMSIEEDMVGFVQHVCDIGRSRSTAGRLSEKHALQIALKMRGDKTHNYIYVPNHVLYDQECMVLQTRSFYIINGDVTDPDNRTSTMTEAPPGFSNDSIPYSSSSSSRSGSVREEVTVHEVVFGPMGDDKAYRSGVTLYFNLDVRKVLRSIKTKRASSSNSAFSNIEALRIHNLDCFSQFTTTDECFYGVVTKILQLRLDILTSCSKTAAAGILTNDDVMKHNPFSEWCVSSLYNIVIPPELHAEETLLMGCLQCLFNHCKMNLWPANAGPSTSTDIIDDNAFVPPTKTSFKVSGKNYWKYKMWEQFKHAPWKNNVDEGEEAKEELEVKDDVIGMSRNEIFTCDIAVMKKGEDNTALPYLLCMETSSNLDDEIGDDDPSHLHDCFGQRCPSTECHFSRKTLCWKSLLDKDMESGGWNDILSVHITQIARSKSL